MIGERSDPLATTSTALMMLGGVDKCTVPVVSMWKCPPSLPLNPCRARNHPNTRMARSAKKCLFQCILLYFCLQYFDLYLHVEYYFLGLYAQIPKVSRFIRLPDSRNIRWSLKCRLSASRAIINSCVKTMSTQFFFSFHGLPFTDKPLWWQC